MAITVAQVLDVIPDSRGNITKIADSVGCTRQAIYDKMKAHKSIADAIYNEKEAFKDQMETTIEDKCLNGDTTMIIFYAKTQMKDRGYVEKQEIDHSTGGEPLGKALESAIGKIYGSG